MSARKRSLMLDRLISAVAVRPELSLVRVAGDCYEIQGGPMLVTYYPQTKMAYVAGTRNNQSWVTPEEAVQMAITPPGMVEYEERERRWGTRMKAHKMRMLRAEPWCHWCSKRLHPAIATVDHKIPVARGGKTTAENLVLACEPCNLKRGSDMPELSEAKNG